MKTLSIITTSYNRAYCLHQLYESLCKQACKDFIWLIIDDGSADDTPKIIEKWKNENIIEIEYYWKPNGGMHTARNLGYEKVQTELNVIIDSDDWVADDAVEKIVTTWREKSDDNIAGIIGLDATPKGEIIGTRLPAGIEKCRYSELFGKYKAKGDKKMVYRSDLSKQFPYPEFSGEKFYPASYKFLMIDQTHQMLLLDEVLCIADYNDDSMTYAKFAQYKNCAQGFAHFRNETAKISHSPIYIIKQYIHYWAEVRYAKISHPYRSASRKLWALLTWLPGLLYYCYLQKTSRQY